MPSSRNEYVEPPWILKKVEDGDGCDSFDCGDADLNEYFRVDALQHRKELLTQTYCLIDSDYPNLVIALLDLCNDSIRFREIRDSVDLSPRKQYPQLPAVKLTRIGVQKEYQRKNIGSHVLNMVKRLFLTDNRTGCRFITVDAYNNLGTLNFYQRNDFKIITEKDKANRTRAMFFDLKRLNLSPLAPPNLAQSKSC